MIKPVQHVLSNPIGCLIALRKNFVLLFIKDPIFHMSSLDVMTQLWYCAIQGVTTAINKIRQIDFENTIETWSKLINNGWELVEH